MPKPAAKTTRWYFGVKCRKCATPILFGQDRSEGKTPFTGAAKLLLTCSKPSCSHRADYSVDQVSRFRRKAYKGATRGNPRCAGRLEDYPQSELECSRITA